MRARMCGPRLSMLAAGNVCLGRRGVGPLPPMVLGTAAAGGTGNPRNECAVPTRLETNENGPASLSACKP